MAVAHISSQEASRYGDARCALPMLTQVARALSAMHARGILHRDLFSEGLNS
jgi:serine/threonine protein kinase